MEIYGAREDPMPGVSSQLIADAMRERQPEADPIGSDVWYVIEEDTAYGQVSKLFEGSGVRKPSQRWSRSFGLERKGNKSGKAASLILQFSQAPQVIDAMASRLDMPIEHRAGAVLPHLMPDAVHLRPLLRAFLTPANFVANFRIKDFRASPGDRAETVLPQKLKRLTNWLAENPLCEMPDLDGRERLDDQLLIQHAQFAQKFQIPFLLQCRMKTADHVNFGDPVGQCVCDGLDDLRDRKLEGVRLAFLRSESAELARKEADVGIVDVIVGAVFHSSSHGNKRLQSFAEAHFPCGVRRSRVLRARLARTRALR